MTTIFEHINSLYEAASVLAPRNMREVIKILRSRRGLFKEGIQRDLQDVSRGRKIRREELETSEEKYIAYFGTYAEREGMRVTGNNPTALLGVQVIPIERTSRVVTYKPMASTYWILKNVPPVGVL